MVIGETAQKLINRFNNLHDDLTSFVANCSDEDWQKVTSAEKWLVGVVGHHIGAVHYNAIGWVKMMVAGESLPPVTMEMVDETNAQYAQENANCTQADVLALLQNKGNEIVSTLSTLSDEELQRKAYLKLINFEPTAKQLVNIIIIRSSQGHLQSMKATVGA